MLSIPVIVIAKNIELFVSIQAMFGRMPLLFSLKEALGLNLDVLVGMFSDYT